jgi:hypothetical protein
MTQAQTARHAVLLGDSVFDNGRYVPGEPDVVTQLGAALKARLRLTGISRLTNRTDGTTGAITSH